MAYMNCRHQPLLVQRKPLSPIEFSPRKLYSPIVNRSSEKVNTFFNFCIFRTPSLPRSSAPWRKNATPCRVPGQGIAYFRLFSCAPQYTFLRVINDKSFVPSTKKQPYTNESYTLYKSRLPPHRWVRFIHGSRGANYRRSRVQNVIYPGNAGRLLV